MTEEKPTIELPTRPESLTELFSRDPMGYTQQDVAKIVAALREARLQFVSADEAAKREGKRVRAPKVKVDLKAPLAPAEVAKLSIDDLLAGL